MGEACGILTSNSHFETFVLKTMLAASSKPYHLNDRMRLTAV
jgi:hypothetical protein